MNKEVSDALHMLFHCARKDSNYETQYEQFRLVYNYINQLEKEVERLKERETLVTEHYDVMVRHAGNLEGKIIQLESNNKTAIDFIDQVLQYHLSPFDYKQVDEDINTLIGILQGSDK